MEVLSSVKGFFIYPSAYLTVKKLHNFLETETVSPDEEKRI
jgi:hypothetical protein